MADKDNKSDEISKATEEVPQTSTTSVGDSVESKEPVPEASGDSSSASWGGWFSNTFNSAKEKSSELYEYIKQDLSEFGESVQEVSRDLKEKLKLEDNARSALCTAQFTMSSFLEQVSTIFGVGPDDEDEAVIVGAPMDNKRIQAKINALALDENIFLNDPEDWEAYGEWQWGFPYMRMDEDGSFTELLVNNPHLQLMYTQLVPDRVEHADFWHRFYYKIHLILKAEHDAKFAEEGNAVEGDPKSEDPIKEDTKEKEEQTYVGAGAEMVDISEEDQKRLLSEYEEEMKKGHSRGSSGTQLSSSSSGSFAFVTHDLATDEVKVE